MGGQCGNAAGPLFVGVRFGDPLDRAPELDGMRLASFVLQLPSGHRKHAEISSTKPKTIGQERGIFDGGSAFRDSLSVYDGFGFAGHLFAIKNVAFTRILMDQGIYVSKLVFAAGLAIWFVRRVVLPRWTGWIAVAAAVLCVASVPAMYGGPADPTGFYNAGGWGPAIVANFRPMIWFLTVSVILIRRCGTERREIVRAA